MLLFTVFLIKKNSTLVRIRDLFRKHLDVLPTADFEFVVISENEVGMRNNEHIGL